MESTSSNDLILESALLKLPQEQLRTNFKSQQKAFEKDIAWLNNAIKQLPQTDGDDMQTQLTSMISRLTGLKRKITALREEEKHCLTRSRARLSHMQQLSAKVVPQSIVSETSALRVQRLVVEYMLRQGFFETAKMLSERDNLTFLLDLGVFSESIGIANALRRCSTKECMNWCNEHKSLLRKTSNGLEFELRRQEFIELIRAGNLTSAILYAQKNISIHREARQAEVDQTCALLCYKPDTTVQPYAALYANARWDYMASLFLRTHHELYNIPSKSPLEVALAAGLSALKTSHCTHSPTKKPGTNISACPICSPELNKLAEDVPFAHAVRSHLVDSLTGKNLEGENEPVVLPNGKLYGSLSLLERNAKFGVREGYLQDPETGQEFSKASLRKAYVL